MENAAQLQAGKPLAPFGVVLGDRCAVLEVPSRSRTPSDQDATTLRSSLAVNSCDRPTASWLRDFPARFLNAVEGWRVRRRLRAQLYALSDDMLKDIGISRWEIEWIVNSPNRDHSDRVLKSCR